MKKENTLIHPDFKLLFESLPGAYLILLPDLTIVSASDFYLDLTKTKRKQIIGRPIFDIFSEPEDHIVANLKTSLEYVLTKGEEQTITAQKYAAENQHDVFEERYWNILNKPVFNRASEMVYILHCVEDVTKFIKIQQEEAEQLKSKVQYQLMVNEVEDYVIILLGLDGAILNWNKGAEKIKGYKAEEVIGKNFRLFYTKEDMEQQLPEKLLAEAALNGKTIHEGWRVRKDGIMYWGSVLITALHDENGRAIGFTKVTRDLTEKKKIDDQLKKFNEELEEQVRLKTAELTDIFERVTDAFIAVDKNFYYTFVNKRTGEMVQRDPASLIGKNMWEEFPDAVDSGTYKAFHKAMNEQVYVNNIDYYAPLDLWQENHIYPSPEGLSIFIRDITVQQKIKEKIEQEKSFSDSIIDSLPAIFYLFDSNGKMIRWNKNFEIVSGYNFDEISNMHPKDFFDDTEKEYILSRIGMVFTEGASDAEAGFLTKSGEKIPYYFTGKRIELDKKPFVIGTGINIAEKIMSEKQLKNSYEHIRALATHLQNIREEERASIAREIHDELGQQLTGIKMNISWLNRKLIKKDEDIEQKIANTLNLTDETVKTIRRIATELRPSILDDLGLVAAIEWHSSEFEKRFGIKTLFSTSLGNIDLSPDTSIGLFRIYQESLTNVLRHANATEVVSDINIKNDTLVLNISDNGKGFDINKIGNKKTLGLLGMRERTFIMGGNYQITSKPGKGTTVTVSVPLTVKL